MEVYHLKCARILDWQLELPKEGTLAYTPPGAKSLLLQAGSPSHDLLPHQLL